MGKVARNWIEHTQDWRDEPMAYWVHLELGGAAWRASESYSPSAPKAEGRNGYPVLCVESHGFVFRFSSAAQLAECVEGDPKHCVVDPEMIGPTVREHVRSQKRET